MTNTAFFPLGALCGDVAGSLYEWNNIRHKLPEEKLLHPLCRFTDDSVLTCAVAEGLRQGLSRLPEDWLRCEAHEAVLQEAFTQAIHSFGNRYPGAGYGGKFRRWLASENPRPYNSLGNGSAMRSSYAGWAARTLQEAEILGALSASVTHNHPQGIAGAKAVAGCIFLLRQGKGKEAVRAYAERYYAMDFTLDGIRESYAFDVTCAGSVPQAITAFLEGESFADVLSGAISIGGDSDTIAAVAGSLAEVIHPIPETLRQGVLGKLDPFLIQSLQEASAFLQIASPY